MSVFALDGVIRDYPWGSTTAIQRLLGREPDGRPAAELWLGAHPDDPSRALDTTLDKLIDDDPRGMLGAGALDAFGPRLPFLLKVLAADRALSIQVHPDLAQARAGFAAEDARGVPRDAPQRTYRDPNHKPELLCALTPFDALCGFRPVEETLRLLDALAVADLRAVREMLAGPDGLRSAFTHLVTLPDPAPLAAAVSGAAARLEGEWAGVGRAVALAAGDFPGDVGAVLALLLNHVRLEPGEAIFLGAGNVHAYLRGTGVEVMANSDNVLRCGLTPKHVDVAALLAVTDFRALPEQRWAPERVAVGDRFAVPVRDFALTRARVEGWCEWPAVGGPQIVLCTEGSVDVEAGGVLHTVPAGHAVYVTPGEPLALAGRGVVFAATVG